MIKLIDHPAFEDYYQLYQCLRGGGDVMRMIEEAIFRTGSPISKRSICILLTSCREHLEYSESDNHQHNAVSAIDIQEYIKEKLLASKE